LKTKQKWTGKQWGFLIVALLVSSAILLAFLEIVTRIFWHGGPSLKMTDPVIGERYWPGYSGKVYVEEARGKVHLQFNRDGFRGPDRPRRKEPGVHRVALMGDSFIAAIAMDPEDTLAVRLEEMLNERDPGGRWEVMNFGISGASTGTELALWRGLVREYRPDIVICAFCIGNDLTDNSQELDSRPRIYFQLDEGGNLEQLPFFGVRKTSSNWLNRHSRFYVWQKIALRKARNRAQENLNIMDPATWIYCSDPPETFQRAWALTDRLIQRFHEEVTAEGGKFNVVLITEDIQVYDDLFQSRQKQMGERCRLDPIAPDRKIEGFCERYGIPFLSLRDSFKAAAPSRSSLATDEWLFCNGSGHFNEAGNRLAAEEILRFLVREGQVP
jgi:hypothetical protein